MNSVELVKKLCKERKIPISKLERDLGYSNGYIGQLRKGVFPTDRLVQIANYLSVPVGYLLQTEAECEYSSGNGFYPPEFFWDKINSDRARFLHYYIWGNSNSVEELKNVWHISIEHPEIVPDETFKRFVEENVRLLGFDPENGEWDIVMYPQKEKTPTLTEKDRRDIARDLERLMADLDTAGDLQFDGDPMSDEARESIKAAMKLGLEAAKLKNKERFTPKKYRKG